MKLRAWLRWGLLRHQLGRLQRLRCRLLRLPLLWVRLLVMELPLWA